MKDVRAAKLVGGVDDEGVVVACDAIDILVLMDIQAIVRGDFAVILQSLLAIGLLVGAAERDVADLKQLRRGEEGHVRGVMKERVAHAALVDQRDAETFALRVNGAGHAGGSGSDDENVDGVGRRGEIRRVCRIAHTLFKHSEGKETARLECSWRR